MGEPHLRLAPEPSGSDRPTAAREAIRVLLADDHTLMRRSLRMLLDDEKNIEVVAEVSELPRVLPEVRRHRPQVLVLDLGMLGGSSRELIARMRELAPRTEIVVIAMQQNPAFAEWALSAGALGFVMKDFAAEDLAQAIHAAVLGKQHVSSRMTSRPASSAETPGRDNP
jgi:DNA-binding NarL/FixJ family response regulator